MRYFGLLGLASLIALAGCASAPADDESQGTSGAAESSAAPAVGLYAMTEAGLNGNSIIHITASSGDAITLSHDYTEWNPSRLDGYSIDAVTLTAQGDAWIFDGQYGNKACHIEVRTNGAGIAFTRQGCAVKDHYVTSQTKAGDGNYKPVAVLPSGTFTFSEMFRSGTVTIGKPDYDNGLINILPIALTVQGSMLKGTSNEPQQFQNTKAYPIEGGWRIGASAPPKGDPGDYDEPQWCNIDLTVEGGKIVTTQWGQCLTDDSFTSATFAPAQP